MLKTPKVTPNDHMLIYLTNPHYGRDNLPNIKRNGIQIEKKYAIGHDGLR